MLVDRILCLVVTSVTLRYCLAITQYHSTLDLGDIHTRSGLHLNDTPSRLWTSRSISLCLRTNPGLIGRQAWGVVALVKISRWYEADQPATLGDFSVIAVLPVPLISLGDSKNEKGTR